MGRIGVFNFELRHPGLSRIPTRHRFNTGDETAFFDDQFVVGRAGKGKRHASIVGQSCPMQYPLVA